jgi:hypothetical protein
VSRVLSVIVTAVAYVSAWPMHTGLWLVTLGCAPLLALIWFPRQIDEFTFGDWYRGYRIDSRTPAVLIAALGWIVLLVFASALFVVRFFGKLPRW